MGFLIHPFSSGSLDEEVACMIGFQSYYFHCLLTTHAVAVGCLCDTTVCVATKLLGKIITVLVETNDF